MRFSVSGRRTVIKRKLFAAFGLFYAFMKNVVLLPKIDYFFFSLDEIEIGIYLFVHVFLRIDNTYPYNNLLYNFDAF